MAQVVCVGLGVLDHVFIVPEIPRFPPNGSDPLSPREVEEMRNRRGGHCPGGGEAVTGEGLGMTKTGPGFRELKNMECG
ncbi:MAG: hypothetical protein Ct9H90mP9_0960 [Pseudomonadota bacterium]|nr:MAG: hypothetical protein Ct9H90mP9_0960 [Pseudomonadota bacterium]